MRNSSSDLLFNKTPYFEKSDFSQEEAYANEGEDDFLDDYYGEEDNNLLQWDPSYGQELDKKVLDEPNNNSNAMKAVAAVGLFSTGIYLITRGISKRN